MARQGAWQGAPALAVAALALFVALGGSVYAAKHGRINGKAIRAKSIPGNRVKPRSLPPNRLRPAFVRRLRRTANHNGVPLTGADINELTLGEVPYAAHAVAADTAQSAVDAETALDAVNAVDARSVNGYGAGCRPGTRLFAGACWQTDAYSAADAPFAARRCAAQGGELPGALELAAFGEEQGVVLKAGDEWSGDITNVSGLDNYSVVTVSPSSEINFILSSESRPYRCVIPLVS
jgi:hypothetical protein